MTALEQLGRHIARSECLSPALRELVELHLIDTVGALIASTRTVEGANLLRFRAAMRARGQGACALDLATRCALARLSEIDDIHLPSMMTPGAIVIPGALTLAAPAVGHHNAATTSRWFAVGNAARNGLNAALAAQQGFTSDRKLFEGRLLPDVLGVTPDDAALTDGLGERIALTEVSFKPWCAARQTMAAAQALKDIVASGVAPAAIDEVAVSVLPPHLKMIDHGVVTGDRASHLTSVQYAMAAAALTPEMAFDVQQTPPDPPPAVRDLMAKIKVEADARLLADYPASWPARVRVAAGSTRHERDVTHVPGDPALPFDRESVRKKFLRFTQPVLGAENAERILARCSGALATGAFSQLIDDIEQACSMDARSPMGSGHGDSRNRGSSISTRR